MKKILYISIMLIFFISQKSYATDENISIDDTIKNQEESFNISDFLKEAKKYKTEFTENIDMTEFLSSALSRRD